jgi:integrase
MPKRKQAVRIITEEEFTLLIKTIMTEQKEKVFGQEYQEFCKLRDSMMYCLMYITGARPKECYEAKIEHINIEKKQWIIPFFNNKQRQTDIITIPDSFFPRFYSYIEKRVAYGFKNSEWLFPTRHFKSPNGKLSRNCVNIKFKEYCKKAGLLNIMYTDANGQTRGDLHPYSFRYSFGTNAYEKFEDVLKVKIMLRHRDERCRATFRYIHLAENKKRGEFINKMYPIYNALSTSKTL